MKGNEYNEYLHAIKAANDTKNKEMLAQIRNRLLVDYGMKDPDVERLLKYFRLTV